jgi:hypothetical protein
MIRWIYFPNSTKIAKHLEPVITAFEKKEPSISSDKCQLVSDKVLAAVADDLEAAGFMVERGKAKSDLIRVPVLYGENGKEALSFEVDAYDPKTQTVIEVEAGRAFTNYQFLKDFYECCMMQGVEYFCVAVRNDYKGHKDFDAICKFFSALFASQRMALPLKGILVIGY